MAVVYWLKSGKNNTSFSPLCQPLLELIQREGFLDNLLPGDRVGIKMHLGERNNKNIIPPIVIKFLAEHIAGRGGQPFLIETSTLYDGDRSNAVKHMNTAYHNGFSPGNVGIPLIIGDGMAGESWTTEEINLANFKKIKIAGALDHTDYLVGIAHPTGHSQMGYAGAIKNIGMGLASKNGKIMCHSGIAPSILEGKCNACGLCSKECSENAIILEKETARIIKENCVGCGACEKVCLNGAIEINWVDHSDKLQEKVVEFTYGILKRFTGKCFFINYLYHYTLKCDCERDPGDYCLNYPGLLVSKDINALEQSTFDIVKDQQTNVSDMLRKYQSYHQVEYGEKIGLGEKHYTLKPIEVGPGTSR